MKTLLWVSFVLSLAACQTSAKKAEVPAAKQPTVQVFTLAGGGYSGLVFESKVGEEWIFKSLTDRGPNKEGYRKKGRWLRPFVNPGFHPFWMRLAVNPMKGTSRVLTPTDWLDGEGRAMSGVPPRHGKGDEIGVNFRGTQLKADPNGIDPESLAVDDDGSFWVGEEYLPSLLHFSSESRLLSRWAPREKKTPKGAVALPEIYARRKPNRGFEGLAITSDDVFAFLQSPIEGENFTRILRISKGGRTIGEFAYPFETEGRPAPDKIGDATALPDGRLLVIEQNGKTGEKAFRRVYAIKIPIVPEGTKEPAKVEKTLVADLTKLGLADDDKAEGLARVDDKTIAVVNDNDFRVVDPGAESKLFLITFPAPF